MNKVITDGLVFMPPPFSDGLDVWSSGDGTPGSDTYDQSGGGAYVPADQDFAGCIEIVKTSSVTKLRYMGETSVLPGCYLRVTAKVKCVSGALPDVRIAGWAGQSGGAELTGVVTNGPSVSITSYGEVFEVTAIIGTGARTGVDMTWANASYGHFGIDLTGANGGVVRVDDITIEDVSSVFLRDQVGIVDVRDYGALGDGVTDDSAAFEAADQDADGREVLVSEGTYFLGGSVTFNNQVRFQGTVTMGDEHRLIFQKNFDYPTYVDAFVDEELAFKKAFQALLNFADHESLDLCGRRISLSEPVDMQAAVNNKDKFEVRRVIRNGQFQPIDGSAWDSDVVVAQATYSASESIKLTNVANISAIQPGSLVTGNGVSREIYVTSVDVANSEVTLNAQMYDAIGTQEFTFTRFKYLLDFSGFTKMSDMILDDIEFSCGGEASGVLLPPNGLVFQVRDCSIKRPKNRGLTSHGTGCQGVIIDRNMFVSDEQDIESRNRQSIAFNVNANDPKIRNNRGVRFRHFCVLQGNGNIIANNHWFQGDNQDDGPRLAGVVLTSPNCLTTFVGNYIDNNFIEWTNEHDATPDATGYSFGGLTITGNIFLVSEVTTAFSWIVIKPHGEDHAINGLSVQGNVFRTNSATVGRVEQIDTTYADLRYDLMRNIIFQGNAFNGISQPTRNPHIDTHSENSVDATWTIDTEGYLPFGGWARTIDALVPVGAIRNGSNTAVFSMPYAEPVNGSNSDAFDIIWPEPVKGEIRYSARMDNPA
ncbi:glycoside hydrolase family 55 protein [Octadecabacter sp. 1_MG-2023]|uniref:glycoside hydrolase family 55 protein n=1 Tax=unclassified Octadecabacter TaxID=196158 RepID=UPI001C0950FC|nr:MULTISPECIES: glycoside hydrolase family 55 protein [unclassified Octadecabacter]MBU2994465.1 glycoside hydrolase family 55 protein [Octadecabacter sp. B2R22]MDO6734244.1 glycoside hydrolase family 55 protein [Octadecabacter sp. 1_MG-2023]